MAKKINLGDAACASDEKLVAKALAQSPGDVHREDGMGFTPLHWAADRGHAGIAKMLLDAGASPDAQDMDGLTPLHFACIKGSLECAKLMIPLADLDIVDYKEEQTAEQHALDSARMAADGFDVHRGAPAQMIAAFLAAEPGRRIAAAQAAVIEASTGPATAPVSKPRI